MRDEAWWVVAALVFIIALVFATLVAIDWATH